MSTEASHKPEDAAGWERAIKAFQPGGSGELESLRAASIRFIGSDWLDIALMAGWDELELWGCFPAPIDFARRRLDCLGLVPALLLGRGCTLREIDHGGATVTRRDTGSRLRHARQLGGRDWAKPWWKAIQTETAACSAQ